MSEPSRLDSLEELESWIERSRSEPVWVFKHSLTCGVSAAALEEFERFVAEGAPGEAGGVAIVEVQRARSVSNELARRTGVRHETPQALLLSDGQAAWHASHWEIRAERLRRAAGELVTVGPR